MSSTYDLRIGYQTHDAIYRKGTSNKITSHELLKELTNIYGESELVMFYIFNKWALYVQPDIVLFDYWMPKKIAVFEKLPDFILPNLVDNYSDLYEEFYLKNLDT